MIFCSAEKEKKHKAAHIAQTHKPFIQYIKLQLHVKYKAHKPKQQTDTYRIEIT